MFKYAVEYEDYNEEIVKEDLYFHLSEIDLIEMEASQDGGFEDYIQKIIDTKDLKSLIGIFKELILKSYGIKDEKGKFHKSAAITEDFASSAAYPEFFSKLATDDKLASEFVMGIIPKKIRDSISDKIPDKN